MLKNYFKITIRNVILNPVYSTINIAGLTLGTISVILISLWVNYELGHDGFHKNIDRIYKIKRGNYFSTVPPLFNHIKNEFPEIENIIRTSIDGEAYIQSSTKLENKAKVKGIL